MDWLIIIFTLILVGIGVLIAIYLDGHFDYTDTIISKERYNVTKGTLIGRTRECGDVLRIVIKREYRSGRVKLISKQIEA